eukprot:UN04739
MLAELLTPFGEANAKVYKENATKILNKAHKLDNHKRIRLVSGEDGYEIHVLCEESTGKNRQKFVFIAVTSVEFGTHHHIPSFCEEFFNKTTTAVPLSEWAASKGSLHKRLMTVLNQIVMKYNTSNMIEANAKVNTVKDTMIENVEMALQNTDRLEELDLRSQDLQDSSQAFERKARSVYCNFLSMYLHTLIILAIVVVVIVIIVVVGLTSGGGGAE